MTVSFRLDGQEFVALNGGPMFKFTEAISLVVNCKTQAEVDKFWAKLSKTDMPGEAWHPRRIFNYYCVHLKHAAQPAFVLDISRQWEKKFAAIRCFHSQFIEGRPMPGLQAVRP